MFSFPPALPFLPSPPHPTPHSLLREGEVSHKKSTKSVMVLKDQGPPHSKVIFKIPCFNNFKMIDEETRKATQSS